MWVQYLDNLKKIGFKFLVLSCLDIFIFEPDLFAKYIAPKIHSFIISSFLEVLDM